jgi:hypothetical protein
MGPVAVLLIAIIGVPAPFRANIRINRQDLPSHHCYYPRIAVGPGVPVQPLFVVFQDDSFWGYEPVRTDVVFQKSTDGGATWLSEDKLICRGEQLAESPDVTTDRDGNIYIAYTECPVMYDGHICCVRSTDGGTTWTTPVTVDDNDPAVRAGGARLAIDTASNLFCIWSDSRTGESHIWSSVSTDRGTTWSSSVRVCDDTVYGECGGTDVLVQPGTNHLLVAATAGYRVRPGLISQHACLYRSTDMGQTFLSGIQLDTFEYAGATHVVADSQHVICDYTGYPKGTSLSSTQARTLFTPPDTWGPCSQVTDTTCNSAYSCELALSADGRVHTALNVNYHNGNYNVCYAFSADHGLSWSERVRVNDDTTAIRQDPAITADSAGYVYVVWLDECGGGDDIWFSTNSPLGIAEQAQQQPRAKEPFATIVRNVLLLLEATSPKPHAAGSLLDIGGRQVMVLKLGANDVRALAPGVYFIREVLGIRGEGLGKTRKVVVTR